MEILHTPPSSLAWLGPGAAAAMFAVTWFVFVNRLSSMEEIGVSYSVPTPEQCMPDWKGEELEEVQLKVLRFSGLLMVQHSHLVYRHTAQAPSNATVRQMVDS